MQKDTEKLEQNTSWEKKFEKAKGTFEVYGEFGMGIDYKKLKEAFSKAITTAVAKRELELVEEVNKILPKDWAEKADKAKKEGDMYTGGFFMGMIDTVEKVLQILKR